MKEGKLKLHSDPMEILLADYLSVLDSGVNLILDEVMLPPKNRMCRLGLLLDMDLSLPAQMAAAARSAFCWLHRLQPYLKREALAYITHAFCYIQIRLLQYAVCVAPSEDSLEQ